METQRPSPEELLYHIHQQQDQSTHGKLKIFFGYAAGVGKTYTMLEAAHQAQKEGRDVVVGYVERHVRPETLALLDGLEQMPCKEGLFCLISDDGTILAGNNYDGTTLSLASDDTRKELVDFEDL